jgi:acyl transferase domain-containing protein/2-polyprenyl-3-methyl-5-hydroxy-6-metoxy-1,4-benzoquinol methylase
MREAHESRVNEVGLSLPTCVAVQIALVQLLRSWGINPTGVTGHSSGEVGAAYAAGAIGIKSAMAIVYARGSLTTELQKIINRRGAMIAVGLSRQDAEAYISHLNAGKVVIACENSPQSVTVSGDVPAIEELQVVLTKDNVFVRRLKLNAAYHSHHMQPIADAYHGLLAATLKEESGFGEVLFSSSTTGGRITSGAEISDPAYWVKNMVQPVEFLNSLRALCLDPTQDTTPSVDMLIEVGPHSALGGPIMQTMALSEFKNTEISYTTCLKRGENAVTTMHNLVCTLLERGYHINLGAVNFPNGKKKIKVLHDLPPYPWNHQVKYWTEPRTNKILRNRTVPQHDLLGLPTVDSQPHELTWRHVIRPTEIPWVRDHQIQSDYIYPGAGYISMAIEAVRQTANGSDRVPLWYRLRDINFIKALNIPDSPNGVEVQLTLRDSADKILRAEGWQDFRVYSTDEDENWNQHCEGLISVTYRLPAGTAESKWSSAATAASGPRTILPGVFDTLPKQIAPEDVYEALRSVGINHGPIFQNITEIRAGQGKSISTFTIADTAAKMLSGHEEKHILHPTTLDSVFQAVYSALPAAGSKLKTAMIPKMIRSMSVLHDVTTRPGDSLEAYSMLHKWNASGFESSVTISGPGNTHLSPVLVVEGLHCQSLGNMSSHAPNTDAGKLCFKTIWKPDWAMMNQDGLEDMQMAREVTSPSQNIIQARRAACIFIQEALQALTDGEVEALAPHHKPFYAWMKAQNRNALCNLADVESSKWLLIDKDTKQSLFEALESTGPNGRMVCRVGRNLVSILKGEVPPIEPQIGEALLHNYFETAVLGQRFRARITQMMKLFCHKKPRAKILEVGTGTGALTNVIIEALPTDGIESNHRFSAYEFTSASKNILEIAQKNLKAYGPLISFKQLLLENNTEDQGFELGSYDLVIASQVFFSTEGVDVAMTNIRKLLKLSGNLLVLEPNLYGMDVEMIFGALPNLRSGIVSLCFLIFQDSH